MKSFLPMYDLLGFDPWVPNVSAFCACEAC